MSPAFPPTIGATLDEIDTPQAIVDLDVLERNVARMAAFARDHRVALRPHVKSHKSPLILQKQLAAGSTGVCVAKLDEAEVMIDAGARDVLVAYEVVGPRKFARLASLARRAVLTLAVDTVEGARAVWQACQSGGFEVGVSIEIDTGLHRCGVPSGEGALELARAVAALPGLRLRGIMTHAGHAYGAASAEEVREIGLGEGRLMVETAGVLRAAGISIDSISVGSTPTAFHSGAVPGVTEMRPGNYVFYDRMQVALGSCQPEDVSLTVLATVMSRCATHVVLDCGSKTLALDKGAHGLESVAGHGSLRGHEAVLQRLSEEHGVATPPRSLQVGQRVEVVPNHACTVVNLFDYLVGLRSGRVECIISVAARGGLH